MEKRENSNVSTTKYLMLLLRNVVFAEPLPEDFAPDEELWQEIHALAKRHHLSHLVEAAVKRSRLPINLGTAHMDQAIVRYVCRDYVSNQIRTTLKTAGIPFIFLKGAVLQTYYPEAWMRTSSDIDVLVRSSDIDAAVHALCEAAGFRRGEVAAHDIQLISQSNVSLELHHRLIMPEAFPRAAEVLDSLWTVATPIDGESCEYRMPETYFYLYHIAHMMKHFRNGGCGIRFFLDLKLMRQQGGFDDKACKALVEQCGMLPFAEAVEKLAEAWFGAGDIAGLETMENYVLSGGIYGTIHNSVAVQQEKDGRSGYLLHRFFPPYDRMKYEHPILQKHRWLLPYFWGRRLLRLCSASVRRRVLHEYRVGREKKKEGFDDLSSMMKQLGMDESMTTPTDNHE